jgi:hypothetical protein
MSDFKVVYYQNEDIFNINNQNKKMNTTAHYCSETLSSKIFLSICPLLLLFGTFTNIFSLLVLSRKRMRKHSTYVYLAILSVFDLMPLWLGMIRDYLAHGYGIYIKSAWLCKLHSFLFYFTLDVSSWILVAVSLDRFFAITFIFSNYTRKKLIKIASKPKFVCSFICIFFFVLNLHFVYYVEIDHEKQLEHSGSSALIQHKESIELNDFLNKFKHIYENNNNTKLGYFHITNLNQIEHLNDALVLNSNSIIETDDLKTYDPKSLKNFPLMVLNTRKKSPSSDLSNNLKRTIGVFDEYFYCVIDEFENPTYVNFFVNVWPFIDLSMYAILPFCIMFVCNIAIIRNVTITPSQSMNTKSPRTKKAKK